MRPTTDRLDGHFTDAGQRDRLADALGCALRLATCLRAKPLEELVRWVLDQIDLDIADLPAVAMDLERAGLTGRERDVLHRLIAGRSNKEIGVDLGITEKTAEVHVSRVFQKLGVSNRVEATTRGILLGAIGEGGIGGSGTMTTA